MDNWDEVCLICGVPTRTPTTSSVWSTVYEVMRNLKDDLPPSFLDSKGNLRDGEEIEQRLTTATAVALDVLSRRRSCFDECLLVGHFRESYKFDVPWRLARLESDSHTNHGRKARPQKFTRLVLPGRGVQIRVAKGNHVSGNFELTAQDRQFFASVPSDPDDRSVRESVPLNYAVHPPEATRGFEQSSDRIIKTSAAPDNYLGCSSFSKKQAIPWEGFGNFWVTKGCFEFLKAWVCLPPVENGLYEAKGEGPLSFEEEFYEVVNSRKNGRTSGLGTMVEMKYDAMHFVSFKPARYCINFHNSSSVAKVLAEEGDDSELVDALLHDSEQWRYCCPDSWPIKPKVDNQRPPSPIRTRVVAAIGCPIINLPTDTLETVLKNLEDARDYFALAQTCTLLYNALQNPERLNQVLREMAEHPSMCLFWIRPLHDELVGQQPHLEAKDSALRVLKGWCPRKDAQGARDDSQLSDMRAVMGAFDDPAFEWAPFVRACYSSDSMRNRRRIWKQVKQIEAMWRDYRLNGWQVNRFITKNQGIRAK